MKSPTVALSSSERHVALRHPRQREPRSSAGTEDRAGMWVGLGIAEIGRTVGGLIRQGSPLPVVLSALCQLFDATAKGFSSSVLLLDRTGARVRSAAGSSLPASYINQLEGRRCRSAETPFRASMNSKQTAIRLEPGSLALLKQQVGGPGSAAR